MNERIKKVRENLRSLEKNIKHTKGSKIVNHLLEEIEEEKNKKENMAFSVKWGGQHPRYK